MDFDAYRRANIVDPAPVQRFDLTGIHGIALYFKEFDGAVAYYTEVLGEPGYIEGAGTRSWRVGDTWLTLLAGGDGSPSSVEVPIIASTPEEAERLQQAFIDAGGTGTAPTDQLMFAPVRFCPVTDPFGTEILVFAPLGH